MLWSICHPPTANLRPAIWRIINSQYKIVRDIQKEHLEPLENPVKAQIGSLKKGRAPYLVCLIRLQSAISPNQ